MGTISKLTTCVALALLVVAPAAAEVYTVTLANGNTVLTRYQPQSATWDAELVMLLTEVGNWIALPRADVVSIDSETEVKGYGTVINTHTIALGWAPNDAPVPGEEEPASPQDRLLQILEAQNQPRPDYSVQQFAEPTEAGGIPVWMTGNTTPPLGAEGPRTLSGSEPPQR